MHIVFIDESGYTPNWIGGITQQPFYALSAICVPQDRLADLYAHIRSRVQQLQLPALPDPSAWGARSRRNETVLTCYQQADAVTMQRALDTRQRLEA